MKNKKVKLLALILIGFISNALSAPIIENFDSFTGSSYTNHVYNGWNIIDGLAESPTRSYLGFGRAVRLNDNNNAALESPSKLDGVGSISFWYRTWDGAPAISKIYIEISDDSTTWIKIDSLISLTNTSYSNYSKVINSNTAKFVKVVSSGEERFIIDKFSISDNPCGGSLGYLLDSSATEICSFDSLEFRGNYYNTAGIYKDTAYSSSCDTIFILNLTTVTPITNNSYDTICMGTNFLFGSQTLTITGTYYDTLPNLFGCDSINILELFVTDAPRDSITDTICEGLSLLFGTQSLTISGSYSDTMQLSSGCDSITVLDLFVTPAPRDSITDTICEGLSLLFGSQNLTTSGIYKDTIQLVSGCDSITVLDLFVTPAPRDSITDTICEGSYVLFGLQTITVSGNYPDTVQNISGCDSIIVLELYVNEIIRDTIVDTICQGSIITFGTKILSMNGIYSDTSQNLVGCDSITVLELTVNLVPRDTIIDTICAGDTLFLGSNFYTVSGLYSDTVQTTLGCDSITTIDLRINLITITNNVKLCPGTPYSIGTNVYTTAGTYTDIFTSVSGCDSTVITILTYYPAAVGNLNYLFCKGDSIQVLGNWYFTDSIVKDTISGVSSLGCDSITIHTIVTKTVSPPLNLGVDLVSCVIGGVTIFVSNAYDTYSWSNGGTTNVLSISGALSGLGSTDYILNVTQASSGCSATDTLNVTFVSCVGIDENEADVTVNLFPNPAANYVTIDVFNKYYSENVHLEVFNSVGKIVTKKMIQNKSEKVIIDVAKFNTGLYFVRISSDKMNITKKLLIQK